MKSLSFRCQAKNLVATLLLLSACDEKDELAERCEALRANEPTCEIDIDSPWDYITGQCSGTHIQHDEDVETVCYDVEPGEFNGE